MKVDGSCHCGAITYTAEVDPAKVTLCHCNDCQVTAGSAFTFNVPANTGSFKLTKGEPTIYLKKTAASGRPRAHGFCSTCATRLYSGTVNVEPAQFALRAGALKQRRELPPKRQIWCSAALDWSQIEGAECIAEQ